MSYAIQRHLPNGVERKRTRATFSTSGPSYSDVGLTTVHHLYTVASFPEFLFPESCAKLRQWNRSCFCWTRSQLPQRNHPVHCSYNLMSMLLSTDTDAANCAFWCCFLLVNDFCRISIASTSTVPIFAQISRLVAVWLQMTRLISLFRSPERLYDGNRFCWFCSHKWVPVRFDGWHYRTVKSSSSWGRWTQVMQAGRLTSGI